LSACPYESTVPLDASPVEPVDSSLVGYWYGIVKDGSDFFGIEALEISKKTDSVYSIVRYGKSIKGDMILPDTAYYSGYTSRIGDMWFMNVEGYVTIEEPRSKKKPQVRRQKVFYASAIERRNDTLDVKTITESFTAKKYLSGPGEFRQLVAEMFDRKKNIFDEQYSIKYRKIPKPQQFFPTN
jgi:hypothetical protein